MSKHHPFRFGVINTQMKPCSAWIEHVRQVENLGYSTLLLRDHFVPDFFGDQYAPIAALATAAAVTTSLRIGTLVIDNDYRHPVMLAKEAATLDVLSGGRLELGLGAGWLRSEYEQAGMTYDRAGVRIDRLEEALCLLKGLFDEEPCTFQGQHYQISNLIGFPTPTQRPHPPILIGAGKQRMLTLAGREANIVGFLTSSVSSGTLLDSPDERMAHAVHEKISWVRNGAENRFDEIELSLCPTLVLSNNRFEAAERYLHQKGWQSITVEDVLAMPSVLIGSVQEIVADLKLRREMYGFSYYIVDDHEMVDFAPVVADLSGK
ncbi:MAG: TIGR03621 family F420-dependent LLM class oxidoreductase [Chloroflexota bacterium]